MRNLVGLLVVCASVGTLVEPARADLCASVQGGKEPTADSQQDVDFYTQLFPVGQRGSRYWNQVITQCNRQRDSLGNEVAKVTQVTGGSAEKRELKASDLDYKVIRGFYNFHGQVALRQKYVYMLNKKGGEWKMILPYKAEINDLVEDRVDFYVGSRSVDEDTGKLAPVTESGHAWKLYDESQVETRTVAGKQVIRFKDEENKSPIAETLCSKGQVTYFSGKKGKYAGMNGLDAYQRDPENKHISVGRIAYAYKGDEFMRIGCRVKDTRDLFWQPDEDVNELVEVKPEEWILDNFVRTAQDFWSIDGVFKLKVWLKGHNDDDFSPAVLANFSDGDHLTVYFATKFMPYGYNQMYKSNPIQYNNFSTMTTDSTYWHEVGHAFGLDDEYGGEKNKTGEPKKNDCLHPDYQGTQKVYVMCSSSDGPEPRSIYHYLAVSRYITKQNECFDDGDCGTGRYCDTGTATIGKNQCFDKKDDNEACAVVGGGHQCKGGHCKFSRCYTPGSVPMGGTCYVDDACKEGKCSSIDGTRGTCVCKDDSDCGADSYCDAGLDLTKNACRPKKNDNESCAAVGGGHQCKGGHCAWGRCYTPDSVPMGGTCYVDAACDKGKCSSIDGTRGTCVCKEDSDCGSDSYCDAGLDLTKNACRPKKNDNESCAAVGGGHQCKGGHCAWGRCYTPGGVSMGGTCYVDAACEEGKCSSVDGTRGTCVCKKDSDCGSGKWCDAGLDLKKNACRNKLKKGEKCGSAGTFGNDHKCKSGKCSGFPNYVCK